MFFAVVLTADKQPRKLSLLTQCILLSFLLDLGAFSCQQRVFFDEFVLMCQGVVLNQLR